MSLHPGSTEPNEREYFKVELGPEIEILQSYLFRAIRDNFTLTVGV